MKTIKQIKQLVENIASEFKRFPVNEKSKKTNKLIEDEYNALLVAIRDKYLPFFQLNIEASSTESAKAILNQISENATCKCFAAYLPDGQHTVDKVGDMVIETPTIMEWQGGKVGQNFVINYTNKTKEKAQNVLNQLVVDMLLSLPGKSFNLHFVDLAFSAQASFLTRNLDEKLYGKLISSPNEWQQIKDSLRAKVAKSLEEYGDVVKYNESKNRVVVPYDVVVITDYQKCLNDMRDLDALFENGHKGGIYFVLMNNEEFKNDRDIDSLMAMTNSYQVLDAATYGNYSKDAFIRCTPILDNPILAKACFNYINEGAELPQVEAASVDYGELTSGGFEMIDKAMVIPVGTSEQGELVDFTLDTVSHIHCFIIGQSGTGKSVFLHDVIIGAKGAARR